MKEDFSLRMTGDKQLLENLAAIQGNKTNILKKAIRAAVKPIQAAVKKNVWRTSASKAKGKSNQLAKFAKGDNTVGYSTWGGPRDNDERGLWHLHRADPKWRGKKGLENGFLILGRTGYLRKSITTKIVVGKKTSYQVTDSKGNQKWKSRGSGKVNGFVGHRHLRVIAFSPFTRKLVMYDPARIAHLVEKGHVLKYRGMPAGYVRPRPYMSPAFRETKHQAKVLAAGVLKVEIERHWIKKGMLPNGRSV
jgi:hypothetical protein